MNTEPTPEPSALERFFRKQDQRTAALLKISQEVREIVASADSPVKAHRLTTLQEIFESELREAMLSKDPPPDFYRRWFFKELAKREGEITELTWGLLVLRLLEQDQ